MRNTLKTIVLFVSSGIAYTLQDLFDTARAAGSVNNTLAEPTGQTRTVVDTGSVLSISGGAVQIASATGANDPKLAYPSVARVAGTMLLAQYTPASATVNRWVITWVTGSTAVDVAGSNGIYFQNSLISMFVAGNVVAVGSNALATYSICIIQRSTGYFLLIKGGVYTFWTLLWVFLANSTTPVNPVSGPIAVSASGGVEDNVRVPVALYIPTPLAYDTFTRANGALGSTETSGPDSQTVAALAWAFTVGKWTIVSNAAVGTPGTGADIIVNGSFAVDANWSKGAGWTIAVGVATFNAGAGASIFEAVGTIGVWYKITWSITSYTSGTFRSLIGSGVGVGQTALGTFVETGLADVANTSGINVAGAGSGSVDNVSYLPFTAADLFSSVLVSTADVIADIALTSTGGLCIQAGIVTNLDSTSNPQNFCLVIIDLRGTCRVYDVVAGVYTLKQSTAVTYSAGAVLRVVRDGTSLRVFYNNAAVGTIQTMTANVNTKHGLFSTSALNSLDAFTLWSRGVDNAYSGLDAF